MKKTFIIAIILTLGLPIFANDFMNDVSDMAKSMIPVYKKLQTCTPASNNYFKIYGLKNGNCHFRYVNYDCYVPMNVAKKYAQNSIKGCNDAINGTFSTQAKTPEAKYNESILNNRAYCSY